MATLTLEDVVTCIGPRSLLSHHGRSLLPPRQSLQQPRQVLARNHLILTLSPVHEAGFNLLTGIKINYLISPLPLTNSTGNARHVSSRIFVFAAVAVQRNRLKPL